MLRCSGLLRLKCCQRTVGNNASLEKESAQAGAKLYHWQPHSSDFGRLFLWTKLECIIISRSTCPDSNVNDVAMRRTPGLVLSCASKSKPQPTINSAPLSQNMTVKVPMHATRPSSQPNRSHAQSSKSVTDRRWFERVHWENTFWVIVFPLFGLAAAMFTPLRTNTAILMFFYHFTTGLGITAGGFSAHCRFRLMGPRLP